MTQLEHISTNVLLHQDNHFLTLTAPLTLIWTSGEALDTIKTNSDMQCDTNNHKHTIHEIIPWSLFQEMLEQLENAEL